LVHLIAVIVFQLIFSVLGSLVVFGYSRHREFHADKGGADLAGKDKMRHALEMLKVYTSRASGKEEQAAVATMKINSKGKKSMLFSTHPDIDERIRRLRSEEHTSELQSRFDLVCRLLLEKKDMLNNTLSKRSIQT